MTLIGLSHRNGFVGDARDGGAERPAVYWAGPRMRNTPLILAGCRFGEATAGGVGGGVFVGGAGAPLIDLGSRRSSGREVLEALPEVAMIADVARLGAPRPSGP